MPPPMWYGYRRGGGELTQRGGIPGGRFGGTCFIREGSLMFRIIQLSPLIVSFVLIVYTVLLE